MKTYHGFNVGDKVIRLPGYHDAGLTGVVIDYEDDPAFVYILLENGNRYGSYPGRIRLVEKGEDFEIDEDFT